MESSNCSVIGCYTKAKSKGFCNVHYMRNHRFGDPLAGGAHRQMSANNKCSVSNCDRVNYGRLMCLMHYKRFVKYGQTELPSKIVRKCEVVNCTRVYCASGYCYLHWQRQRKGISLEAPIRESHGMVHTAEYKAWSAMNERCRNPNCKSYKDYGGRGISVCKRWESSFVNFYEDMGERPKDLTLDRTDNDGNYEPGNCRWATRSEQQYNRRPFKGLVEKI